MLSYPSAMTVASRALNLLADALRQHRNQFATRWRKLSAGRQALLVVAYILGGIGLAIEQWPSQLLEARSLPLIYRGAEWAANQLPPKYRPAVARPPAGRATRAADLLRANPVGRALGTRPVRE